MRLQLTWEGWAKVLDAGPAVRRGAGVQHASPAFLHDQLLSWRMASVAPYRLPTR